VLVQYAINYLFTKNPVEAGFSICFLV